MSLRSFNLKSVQSKQEFELLLVFVSQLGGSIQSLSHSQITVILNRLCQPSLELLLLVRLEEHVSLTFNSDIRQDFIR
jgi:hypothetical protein